MPTATTTSPKAKRRKPARRKTAAARKTTSTRTLNGQAPSTARRTVSEGPAGVIGDYAERAVLIPVGATLIARDRFVSGVTDTIAIYSSPSKTQAQLRKFERRGVTARKRLEREVRKTRTRVERELRQRRREVEKTVTKFEQRVSKLEKRRDTLAKNGAEIADRIPELANRVQERVLSLV